MLKQFLVLFLISCYFPTTSDACSCMPYDSLYSLAVFCGADWVAEVTVTNTTVHEYYYEFSINYTEVYKMPSKFNETYPVKIYSHVQSSACGLKLPENIEFILVGHINKEHPYHVPIGEVYVAACSYLDSEFKEKLRINGTTSIDCSELKAPWV